MWERQSLGVSEFTQISFRKAHHCDLQQCVTDRDVLRFKPPRIKRGLNRYRGRCATPSRGNGYPAGSRWRWYNPVQPDLYCIWRLVKYIAQSIVINSSLVTGFSEVIPKPCVRDTRLVKTMDVIPA